MPHRPAVPEIVAHRGNAADYPENSLPALESALAYGVRFVEFDIQLTADRVPVLCHDAGLKRTAGVDLSVLEMTVAELADIEVNEPERFGRRFRGVRLPLLEQAVALLEGYPQASGFVELKRESLQRFGTDLVVSRVRKLLRPLRERAIVISFERDAIEAARDHFPVGWVLRSFDRDTQRRATSLNPEFLFCNVRRIPEHAELWSGGWQWAVYEISDPAEAPALYRRGADLIETMAVARFVEHPLYRTDSHA